jgi:hypothetical protein
MCKSPAPCGAFFVSDAETFQLIDGKSFTPAYGSGLKVGGIKIHA